MNADLLRILFETTLATSAAVLLVLAMRRPLMARLGASVAYAAWALVPVAGLAMLLPAPESVPMPMTAVARIGVLQPVLALAPEAETFAWTSLAMALWASGALATAALFAWQQRRFQHRLADSAPHGDGLRIARASEGLPAVIGLLRPRIVLPADFETRYDADERELILCHERIHVARRDLWANAAVAALRALFWFNPLLHYAAWRFRRDQELACDERVVARHPQRRRDYAGAMLKTQMADSSLPVGCHWQASTPLKERIAMLKEHAPKPMRSAIGAALVSLLLVGGGYAAWAAQPAPAIAAKTAERFSVRIQLGMNGQPVGNFKVVAVEGQPFGFVTKDAAGRKITGKFTVRNWDAKSFAETAGKPMPAGGLVKLMAKIDVDGEKTLTPVIGVKLGTEGSIKMKGDASDSNFDIEARVDAPTAEELSEIEAVESGSKVENRCFLRADDANNGYYCGESSEPVLESTAVTSGVINADSDSVARMSPPTYPVDAAKQGISGSVMLVVDVTANGNVSNAAIEKSRPAGVFDAAALEAVKHWKFKPVLENGKPVASRVRVPVDFKVDPPTQVPQGKG